MASTSRSTLSMPSQNSVPDPHPRKRTLSASSETSSEEDDDNKTATSKRVSRSPVRRAVSVPAKAEDQPKANRDKKKRRKKKRKISVVQGPLSPEKTLSQISNAPGRRSSISLAGVAPPSNSGPVAGPSTLRALSPGLTASTTTVGSTPEMSDRQPSAGPSTLLIPSHMENNARIANASASIDKGKGKAIDIDAQPSTPTQSTVATNTLATHQALFSSLIPTLTCRVCLLLMNRPFALAPCGHAACHGCLVNWFSQADPSAPPDMPSIPIIRRRKTCPHCRAIVSERPVEVWTLKETIDAVIKSGLVDADLLPEQGDGGGTTANEDPWKNIFTDIQTLRHNNIFPGQDDRLQIGLQDVEDGGIFRCVDCMHEIWAGVCSGCHRPYPAHRALFHSDDSDEDVDDIDLFPFGNVFGGRLQAGTGNQPIMVIDDPDTDGSDYEGSFIDDDDDVGIPPRRGYIRTHGIDEHLPPYPRFSPSPELIILSDEEGEESDDDDDVRSRGQSSRGARSFGRVVFSDDDDDEEDDAGQQGSEDEDGPPFLPPTTRPIGWSDVEEDYADDDDEDEVVDEVDFSLHNHYSDDDDEMGYYSGEEDYDPGPEYF